MDLIKCEECEKEKDNPNNIENETKKNGNHRGDIISFFVVITFVLFLCGCTSTKKGPEAYINTKWKTEDGYVLEIGVDSCQITKNGSITFNRCYFIKNTNDSGDGKIQICGSYGVVCSTIEILSDDNLYDSITSKDGITWYKQKN